MRPKNHLFVLYDPESYASIKRFNYRCQGDQGVLVNLKPDVLFRFPDNSLDAMEKPHHIINIGVIRKVAYAFNILCGYTCQGVGGEITPMLGGELQFPKLFQD